MVLVAVFLVLFGAVEWVDLEELYTSLIVDCGIRNFIIWILRLDLDIKERVRMLVAPGEPSRIEEFVAFDVWA